MLDLESLPDDFFVTHNQFTKKVHRDVYPAIDPAQADLSQAGKVIVITGANRPTGIGKLVGLGLFLLLHLADLLSGFRSCFRSSTSQGNRNLWTQSRRTKRHRGSHQIN